MDTGQSGSAPISATALHTFEIFSRLSLDERSSIARLMRSRTYPANTYVISTSLSETDIYFIISGNIRACAFTQSGKQVYFEDLSAGMMFGELAAIDKGERSNDCIAIEESHLAILSSEDFLDIIQQYPEVQRAVLRRLVGMVRNQMQRVYEFTSFSVNQRVRFELLRMASGVNSGKTPVIIDHPPTHADLAARISTHREAVTRELKKLEAIGLITWRPGQYFIHDVGGLSQLASS